MTQPEPIPLIDGLSSLVSRYDLILCDVWGVLHNGVSAYPRLPTRCRAFAKGGRVVLVSNAPRPGPRSRRSSTSSACPARPMTPSSPPGDLTRLAIEERPGQVVHHIGPPRDMPIFEGLDVRFGPIGEADYVVCSGFDNDERETIEDYASRLEAMRARELLMVCANPDLVVERGDMIVPCAGTIALAYEEMGGAVFYAGKPHRPVYERALAVASELSGQAIPKERVLAVGDAIRTDIAGAVSLRHRRADDRAGHPQPKS